MSTDIVDIGLRVDSSSVNNGERDLDKLGKRAKTTETAIGRLARTMKNAAAGAIAGLGRSLKALSNSMATMAKYAALAGVAIAGLIVRSIIQNTIAQEQAMAQLEAAIKSTGGAAGYTAKELKALAGDMQKVTTFGDEVVMGMQSILLTFTKIGRETFPRASEAVVDLAVRMGMDLKSAALQVGKALNDPATGLSMLTRAGIQFTDSQKEMIKSLAEAGDMAGAQALILKELETQFGGSARAARNTLGGALSALKNAFGDLLEADSGVKGTSTAINDLTKLLSSEQTKKAFATLTTAVIDMMGWLAKAIQRFVDFGEAIGVFFAKLTLALSGTPAYYTRAAKASETLSEQIERQRGVVTKTADELALSMEQYEALTKHIDSLSGASGVSTVQIEMLRAKQAELKLASEGSSEALAKEVEELKNLQGAAMEAATIPDSAPSGAGPHAPTQEEIDAAQEARERRFEQEQDWLEELDAMEKEYKDQKFQEEQNWLEELDAMEKEYQDQKFQQKLDYLQGIDHEEEYYASKSLERDRQINELKKQAQSNFWSDMISLGSSNSKKLFDIGKIAAVANAVVDGYAAATSAWRVGMASGPWTAAAYMAASIAKTAGLIKSITSASFSGGSKSVSAVGGGGSPTSGTGSAAEPITPVAQTATVMHDVSIVVSGGLHSDEDVRNLVERINEIREDMGGNVNFVPS